MRLVAADAQETPGSVLMLGRLAIPRPSPLVLGPILLVALLAKLAISDGGRHAETLTLVQTVAFVAAAILVVTGWVRRTALTWPMVGMMAVIAASVLWSVRPESGLRVLMQWGAYVSIYVVTTATLTSRAAARRFVDAAVVIAGWLALIALYLFWGSGDPSIRWYSTFYWPNPFATFLLLALPVQVIRCLSARTVRESLAHGAMAVLLAVPFVLTYSRGGWLALAAVIPLTAFVVRPPSRTAALGRLTMILVVTAVAVVLLSKGGALSSSSGGVVGRAASITDSGDYSIQGRLHFWRGGLAILGDHPLTGTGAGTFGYVFASYQRDVRYYSRDAHNLYIQTGAEMGIPGLIALAAILVSLGAMGRRVLRKAGPLEDDPMIAGVVVGVAAFFVHSAIEMSWSFPANPALAFALLGVLAWYDRPTEPLERAREVRAQWWRWVVAAMFVAAVVLVQLTQATQREFRQGRRLAAGGQWEAAAARFRNAARLSPIDAIYPSALADAVQRSTPGGTVDAIVLIRRAMALDEMNAYYPLQLARLLSTAALLNESTRREAIALVERALRLDPFHYPEGYRLLARLLHGGSDPRAAEEVYKRAKVRYGDGLTQDPILRVRLWPGVAALYMEWARFLREEGRPGDALVVYEDILEEDARYVPAYLDAADLLRRQGRSRDAAGFLARGLRHAPSSEVLWEQWRSSPTNRTEIWEK